MTTRHIAGLARLAGRGRAAGARSGVDRDARAAALLGAGLIGGLALLSAISSLWSGSIELSVIEADRVLVYLGFFLAAFLIAQTDERRQRFAEGLAIAVTLVALLGSGKPSPPPCARCRPRSETGPRLRYPLDYWNANGTMFGIAVATLPLDEPQRGLDGAALALGRGDPGVLLALYFTYSRGGLLALAGLRRDPDRPLARPALAAGDAGDRRARGAAGGARRPGPRTASPTTSPTRRRSTRGSRSC